MKKYMLFLILMLIGTMSISAQSSNNEQNLIGTWVNVNDNSRLIINANGSITGSLNAPEFDDTPLQNYVVANDKIYLYGRNIDGKLFDFRISNDGRVLIIYYSYMGVYFSIAFRRN